MILAGINVCLKVSEIKGSRKDLDLMSDLKPGSLEHHILSA